MTRRGHTSSGLQTAPSGVSEPDNFAAAGPNWTTTPASRAWASCRTLTRLEGRAERLSRMITRPSKQEVGGVPHWSTKAASSLRQFGRGPGGASPLRPDCAACCGTRLDRPSRAFRRPRPRTEGGLMRGTFRIAHARYVVLALLFGMMIAAALLSPVGSASTKAVPSNTVLPAITGTAAVGQTVSTSDGTWTGSPTSFTYEGLRCPSSGGSAAGSDRASIVVSTNNYAVATGDVGFTLRSRVTAVNSDGQAKAVSNATAVVVAQAGPPNTAPPTISGTPTVGSTLKANPGTWPGSSITFAYQWRQCDASGANSNTITGATGNTYVIASGDVGHTIRVAVTGTDATGPNTVTSAPTATVTTAPAPPTTGCPADKSTTPINVSQVSPPARLLIDKQESRPNVITGNTQTIVLRFHVSACSGRSIVGALVYQTATPYQQFSPSEAPTGADGWATLTLRRLRHFPASEQQGLLVVFVRARKTGEDLLGGISSRRLVSFRVNLRA